MHEWILRFHLIKCYGSWWIKVVNLAKNVVYIVEWMVQNRWLFDNGQMNVVELDEMLQKWMDKG